MKLTYRGISYDYNPPTVQTTTGQVVGKYRGLDWRFRNLENPPVLQPRMNLTYRGVTYNQPATTETVVTTEQTAVATENKARLLMMQRNRDIKKRQQTLLRRVASEVGLSDVSNYWNHIQGKVHPSFRTSYDRYGATMS